MARTLARSDWGSTLDNPPATLTALLGTALAAALAVLVVHAPRPPRIDRDLEALPFTPGLVLALGSPEAEAFMAAGAEPSPEVAEPESLAEPDATPEPDTTTDAPDTPTTEPSPESTVTDQPTPPTPRPPRPPRPNSGGHTPPSPSGPPAPPAPPSRGDPFGDPAGFDDLMRDGDAWAGGVIAALRAMQVGTVYAKPIDGTVRFHMTICKDGTVSRVSYKGGTARVDERDLVLLEIGRLKIPRPPPEIAAKMKSSCVKLRHDFTWSDGNAR